MPYLKRALEAKLIRYASEFPVVVLTGCRQAGKSTLLNHLFTEKWEYINFDERGVLERAIRDPDLFVKNFTSNVILDEVQKAPSLFHSIKWIVDRGTPHKIILSGSANFHLMGEVTETLAGRAGILELYPLSLAELEGRPPLIQWMSLSPDVDHLFQSLRKLKPASDAVVLDRIYWGGFPKLSQLHRDQEKRDWFESYRTTYLERDLRNLAQVGDLGDFQKLYQLLAFQTGGLLNLSNLANEIGISVPTCKKYVRILETSYQYFLLKPFYANMRKRLVKSPKAYLTDTGLGIFLTEVDSVRELNLSGKLGRFFENWVVAELIKNNSILDRKLQTSFWRTSSGLEVDLLLETGKHLFPLEIKSALKIEDSSIRGLVELMKLDLRKTIPFGLVIYRGEEVIKLRENILAVPAGLV